MTIEINKDCKLLAIDPSLTASGWALFRLVDHSLVRTGLISPPGPRYRMADRLDILQQEVQQIFIELRMGRGDILICEGPAPLLHNPQSVLKVERVRGIFEVVARSSQVSVPGRLNPRTLQVELLGMRGKQLERKAVKAWARETAIRLYGTKLLAQPIDCNASETTIAAKFLKLPQDIIDAVLIGDLAINKIKRSLQAGEDLRSAFSPRTTHSSHRVNGRRATRWSENEARKLLKRD